MKTKSFEIEQKIYLIQGIKVMLDQDLAVLYQVPTKRLNEQVKRNKRRFPEDFMFQLKEQDLPLDLRSQFATSSSGGRRYLPYAFTEQGIAMLSSVLKSERAVDVNIAIMRAFVRMRHIISLNKEIAEKLKEFEVRLEKHDNQFKVVFEAIRRMMIDEEKPKPKIGFHVR